MRKHLGLAWVLGVVALAVVACGEGASVPEAEQPAVGEGMAILEPIGGSDVSGEATLLRDPGSSVLTVTVQLDGVEEGVTYTSQITPGCGRGTGHIHKLDDLIGGSDGTASATTEITQVETLEVTGDWAVKVGRPPGGSPGGGPQACGEVTSP